MARQTLLQVWVASGVLMNMYVVGMITAFPSILLPDVMSEHSLIKVDLDTGSWLASIIGVTFIPGFLVTAVLINWCGRRLSHLLLIIPAIIGWLIIYFSHDIISLIVGRGLGGLSVGGTVTLSVVVIGEYTSPKLRGFLLNFKTAVVCLGKLTVHALGHFFHWRTVAMVAFVFQTISAFMTLTWPLSPAWLLYKNRFKESEQSFFKLRSLNEETEKEFNDMLRAQKERQTRVTDNSLIGRVKDFFKHFFQRDFLKPFAICAVALAMVECTGRHFYPPYAIRLIEALSTEKTATICVVIGIDVVIALGAAATAVLASSVRRRTLVLSSGFSAVLVLVIFCTHEYLVSYQVLPVNQWIPISLLFLYFTMVNLGAGPITFALMGELFPLAHRGLAPGLLGVVISLYMTISLKFTPILLETVKIQGVFAVFGSGLAVFLVILYFILPETKDRTLQEIEDYFKDGRFKDEGHTRKMLKGV